MKKFPYTAISLGFIALLSGCGSSSSTSTSSTTESSEKQDITDAILSNRSANCEEYVNQYVSYVNDIQNDTNFEGSLDIEVADGKCTFTSNAIPNHDFNDETAAFATDVSEQSLSFSITANPTEASEATALSLTYDNAIILNGVKLDELAAGCYGVADGNIGCNDINQPFRYDPMSPAEGASNFGVDEHHAHVQPGGEYHYHGDPKALYDTQGESESPVIGFAADGFPIYGSYINDGGNIRKVTSSYELKLGIRSAVTYNGTSYDPGGEYDGLFVDDYEYVANSGDLDECNGMTRDGSYGYYVTESYPWVIGCFKGTPDESFSKGTPGG